MANKSVEELERIIGQLCEMFEDAAAGDQWYGESSPKNIAKRAFRLLADHGLLPPEHKKRLFEKLKRRTDREIAQSRDMYEFRPYEQYEELYGEWPPDSDAARRRFEEREREREEKQKSWFKERKTQSE